MITLTLLFFYYYYFFIAGKGVGWGTERGWGPRQQTVNTYILLCHSFLCAWVTQHLPRANCRVPSDQKKKKQKTKKRKKNVTPGTCSLVLWLGYGSLLRILRGNLWFMLLKTTGNEIMTHLKLAAICAVILRSSSMVSAIQDLLMKWKTSINVFSAEKMKILSF